MVFGCGLDDAGGDGSELYDAELKCDDDLLRHGDHGRWVCQWVGPGDGDDRQRFGCAGRNWREPMREWDVEFKCGGDWWDPEVVFGRGLNNPGRDWIEFHDAELKRDDNVLRDGDER